VDEYLNEQEQWDSVRAWLRQNGVWLVAGVLLAAVGVWGWRAWQAHEETLLTQASAQYEKLVAAFSRNDLSTVSTLADQLSADHPGTGYAEQAQLAAARLQVENKQLPAAIDRMQKVLAKTSDPELALVVRLRIARTQIEMNKPDDALATLAAAQPGAFASRFAEVRGDALYAKGDRAGAYKAYTEAQAANAGAPSNGDLLALKINSVASARAAP